MYFEYSNFNVAYVELNKWLSSTKELPSSHELLFEETVFIKFTQACNNSELPNFNGTSFEKNLNDYNSIYPLGEKYFKRETEYYAKEFSRESIWLINYLSLNIDSKRCVVNFWHRDNSDLNKPAPCLTQLIFRLKNNKLDMHAYMRANDAYRIAFINFHLFRSLQNYICDKLHLIPGDYYHIASSFHVYRECQKEYNDLVLGFK